MTGNENSASDPDQKIIKVAAQGAPMPPIQAVVPAKSAHVRTKPLPKEVRTFLEASDTYNDYVVLNAIVNLMEYVKPTTPLGLIMCMVAEQLFEYHLETFGFPVHKKREGKENKDDKNFYYTGGGVDVDPQDWEILKIFFSNLRVAYAKSSPVPTRDHVNLMKVADYMGLDEVGKKSLGILCAASKSVQYGSYLRSIMSSPVSNRVPAGMACMIGQGDVSTMKQIEGLIGPTGTFCSYGFMTVDDSYYGLPSVNQYFMDSVGNSDIEGTEVLDRFVGKLVTTDLNRGDFKHVEEELDHILKTVKTAVAEGKKGVNILIHGPAGSGKSELAKVIAKELGLKVFSVGEDSLTEKAEDEQLSERRLYNLSRAQAFLKGNKSAILYFDEIEDILLKGTDREKKADTESKVGVNRIFENNPVVTIWTGNDPDKFHTAVRQRFTYSLYMGYPPTLVRKRMWERQLQMQKTTLPAADILSLARRYDAPPRLIEKGIEAKTLTKGDVSAVEMALEAAALLTFGGRDAITIEDAVPANYDLSIVNAGPDTEKTVETLVARGTEHKNFSLLLRADEGSGGPSLLRYVAENIIMNPVEVNVKDLVQPAQVPPEVRIQQVFKIAADNRSFLILRNFEALTQGDTDSRWNSSLVKTFCEAARAHKLPMAVMCTPKLAVPEKVSQYFSHKMEIKPLTAAQATKAYGLFFNRAAPSALDQVANLVPGDFDGVRRVLNGEPADDSRILNLLKKQQEFRAEKASSLGFGRAATP